MDDDDDDDAGNGNGNDHESNGTVVEMAMARGTVMEMVLVMVVVMVMGNVRDNCSDSHDTGGKFSLVVIPVKMMMVLMMTTMIGNGQNSITYDCSGHW